jgi:hypothetical protein
MERGVPACPEPMTMASYSFEVVLYAECAPTVRDWDPRHKMDGFSESGNEKQSQSDCDQIFRDGNCEIRSV